MLRFISLICMFLLFTYFPCNAQDCSTRLIPYGCECSHTTEGKLTIGCIFYNNNARKETEMSEYREIRVELNSEGKSLGLKCVYDSDLELFERLHGFVDENIENIYIHSCAPPKESLGGVLDRILLGSLYTSSIRKIYMFSMDFSSSLDYGFQSKHFYGLNNITFLDISLNSLSYLPSDIFISVPRLTTLVLNNNLLTDLPCNVFDSLSNLINLDLSGNQLTNISKELFINISSSLKTLKLSYNELREIDVDSFKNMNKLENLNLVGNNIEILPENLFQDLTSLEKLSLSHNRLKFLPAKIFKNLNNLNELYLEYNNLDTLHPDLFKNLKNIKRISLRNNNKLSLANEQFSNLHGLQILSLSRCNLTQIPQHLLKNSTGNLIQLQLQENKLTTLPLNLLRGAEELMYLNISHNYLHTLPDDIFQSLHSLKYLNIGYNNLGTISKDLLRNLKDLENLNLENNQLTFIHSDALLSLARLKVVTLSRNKLTFAEEGLNKLSPLRGCESLHEIHLAHNQLTEVMQDWHQLQGLCKLNLSNNLIHRIEMEDLDFPSYVLTLDLRSNLISEVDLRNAESLASAQAPGSKRSVRVLLDDNPVDCTSCANRHLLLFLEKRLAPSVSDLVKLDTTRLCCGGVPPPACTLLTNVSSDSLSACGIDV